MRFTGRAVVTDNDTTEDIVSAEVESLLERLEAIVKNDNDAAHERYSMVHDVEAITEVAAMVRKLVNLP